MKAIRHHATPPEVQAKATEHIDAMRHDPAKHQEFGGALLQMFLESDVDGDGMLSLDEFKGFLGKYGEYEDKIYGGHSEYSDEDAQAMWDMYRFSGQAGITQEDFT